MTPLPNYHPRIGFVLEWDFVLHLPANFTQARLIYQIYQSGKLIDPARSVEWKDLKVGSFEIKNFGYVIFNTKHLIKEMLPNPDILIVMEIQVSSQQGKSARSKGPISKSNHLLGEKAQEGYPTKKIDLSDLLAQDEEEQTGDKYIPYGWSIMNLFTPDDELIAGIWKVPLYKPPTRPTDNVYSFQTDVVRLGDPAIWMRIAYPDNQTDLECSPAFARLYSVPRIHQFKTVTVYMNPDSLDDDIYDPDYEVEGVLVQFHYLRNFIQDNKI